jgi:hypothetical protein
MDRRPLFSVLPGSLAAGTGVAVLPEAVSPCSSFLEHLTPDVGHNIVIIDYKVNYDYIFFLAVEE